MVYLTNSGSLNMADGCVNGNSLKKGEEFNLDHLKEIMKSGELKVCINNMAIIRTISRRLNIEIVNNVGRISLQPGDIFYRIKPSDRIEQYRNEDQLPDEVTLKLEMWSVQ